MPALANVRHESFARVVARGTAPSRAAVALGYKPDGAWDLSVRPDITARVAELMASQMQPHEITSGRVMMELGRIAFSDVRDIFDDQGNLIPIHKLSDDAAASITGIEHETRFVKGAKELDLVTGEMVAKTISVVTTKIKRANKDAALSTLAKHFKLVGDEGDGVNALANALADRLKTARRRTIDITPDLPEIAP